MFRSLYAKLGLVLFGLFCLVGGIFLAGSLYAAQMYQQEVAQRLNRDLAMYIVREHVLIRDGEINRDALKGLFHKVMIINPSLELYLLGPGGEIIAYSGDPSEVRLDRVSLRPVETMLAGRRSMPVLGDNPRNPGSRKVFSAAPIERDGVREGYIYAVLGSQQVQHAAELLQQSYILRWSAVTLGVALLFAFAAGLAVFFLLTRRVRALSQAMEDFRRDDFTRPVPAPPRRDGSGDEIDSMAQSFHDMAEHIRAQMERLRETDALRRELVANVSHDLRTPLASLQGYLETLMLKESDLSADERRAFLETACRNADTLGKLIVELFELARLDANEVRPRPEPFSIAELIQDVLQKFVLRAREKDVRTEIDALPDIPYVEGDIGMIERVLDNLIENAIRHTPAGGTVKVCLAANGDHVAVSVSDTGQGIPADQIPHIFKRFYRMPARGDGGMPGAGLGLAIAQRIVELHGARLSVSSVPNEGTAFGFDLPTSEFAAA